MLARGLSAIDAASPAEAWVEQWEEQVGGAGDQPAVSTLLERPTTRYLRLATRYSLLATRDSRLATRYSLLTSCHSLRTSLSRPTSSSEIAMLSQADTLAG